MKVFLGNREACGFDCTYQDLEDRITFCKGGHVIVDNPEEADLIVFPNTCSGTALSIDITINYIKDILRRKNSHAITYLTGCITRSIYNNSKNIGPETKRYFDFLKKYLEKNINFILPDGNVDKLLQLMFPYDDEFSSNKEGPYFCVEQYPDYSDANIFVAKGCMNSCTFCKATYQNFQLSSINIDYIKKAIDSINDSHKSPRLYLTASNVTQYGLDLYGQYMLSELLRYIETKENITTIGLFGFAFKDAIKQNLDQILKGKGKPLIIASGLESGSNRILSLMNKGYTVEEIKKLLEISREERKISLSLNIIAGFPTETAEDIDMTIDLLNEIKPYHVNLCTYTDSPFIPSHDLPQFHPQDVLEHAEIYSKKLEKSHIPHIKSF